MRRGALFGGIVLAVAAGSACVTDVGLPFDPAATTGTPTPTSSPTGSATPTPTPTITPNLDPPLAINMATSSNAAKCTAVTLAAAGNDVTVVDATPFVAHDEVLLLQVQSSVGNAPAANAPSQLGPLNPALQMPNFAFHQFAIVVAISGNVLTLASPHVTLETLAPNGTAELCRVPVYPSVTIQAGGDLKANAWDGAKGGVVAFEVLGDASIEGDIKASGAGFRGGAAGTVSSTCGAMSTTDVKGGQKGEGNDARWFTGTFATGRGAEGIGGGGGDSCGAGGAGGGNGGAGGIGGDAQNNDRTGGVGGLAVGGLTPVAPMFGGGGGGGADTGNGAVAGGAGGGLIWLRLHGALAGGGGIRAPGDDGGNTSDPTDGMGGGGAGGTIILEMLPGSSSTFTGPISARGGGGSTTSDNSATARPGGGGGGGRIVGPAPGMFGPFYSTAGGAAGVDGGANAHNAADGAPGSNP